MKEVYIASKQDILAKLMKNTTVNLFYHFDIFELLNGVTRGIYSIKKQWYTMEKGSFSFIKELKNNVGFLKFNVIFRTYESSFLLLSKVIFKES